MYFLRSVAIVAGLVATQVCTAAQLKAVPAIEVQITFEDGTHSFQIAKGKDLGDFEGPGFVERNVQVKDATIPFAVYFRPDRNDERLEIVFEWGDVVGGTPRHLGPYTATIFKDGAQLARVEVPNHYWLSRWRWQSAMRPIVKTVAALIDEKWVPPFTSIATVPMPGSAPDYAVMGLSDITPYMPTTGERPDIGLMPERYAAYLATGNADLAGSVLAWGEASGTLPWHVRDFGTNAPLSYDVHPDASTYDNQAAAGGHPMLHLLPAPNITIDGAHQPALAYLPYLMTGDPYYLEELQFAATFALGDYPHHGGIIRHDQTREFAWTLRTLFYVAKATPEHVPSWLLPKAYWQEKLTRNLHWTMTNFVDNPATKTATFNSGVDTGRMPFWQEDYLAAVLGVGVWMGYSDWAPVFRWKIKSNIARTNGTSGWPRSHPTFYYSEIRDAGTAVRSWKELAVLNKLDLTANDQLDAKVDRNYAAFSRAALAMAVRENVSDSVEPYKWLDGEIRHKYVPWRWAIDTEPDRQPQ